MKLLSVEKYYAVLIHQVKGGGESKRDTRWLVTFLGST